MTTLTKANTATKATKATTATKTAKSSKMTKAMAILMSVYGDSSIDSTEVRQTCIARFRKDLNMQKTTASTYLAHVQRAVITQEQDSALEKAGKDKPVYSTYRTGRGDKSAVATLAGAFLTRKKAVEINTLLRLPKTNIVKGVVSVGQVIAA